MKTWNAKKIACLALLVMALGCGGSGGGPSAVSGVSAYQADVVVVPPEAVVSANGRDSEVILNKAPDGLEPGKVLVSKHAEGVLRRVKTIDRSRSGSVVIQTDPANLEDLYATHYSEDANHSMLAAGWEFVPDRDGIDLEPASRVNIESLPLRIRNLELGPGVHADGTITIRPSLDWKLDINFGRVREFRCVPRFEIDGSVKISGSVNATVKYPIRLGKLRPSRALDLPGPSVVPEFDIYTEIEGAIKPGCSLTLQAGATVRAGVVLKDGAWGGIREFTPRYSVTTDSKPSARVDLNWNVLRIEAGFKIYGVAGPYVKVDLPRLTGFAEKRGDCVHVNLDAIVAISAGVKVEILSKTILNAEFPDLFHKRWNVISADVFCSPTNLAPVAHNTGASTMVNQAVGVTLHATDANGDPLTYTILAGPAHGTLSGNPPHVTYSPHPGFVGNDAFTWRARDGQLDSNVATCNLEVRGAPPGAVTVDERQWAGDINGVGYFHWGTPSNWREGTDCGYDGHYFYTWSTKGGPMDNVGQWRPNLGGGNFEVFAFIPRCEGRSSDARYEIWINGVYHTYRSVNQLAHKDQWVSLGTYHFPAGSGSFVRLGDVTNENDYFRLVHDAMKWEPR